MRSFIIEEIERFQSAGLLRQTRLVDGPVGRSVTMEGGEKLLFCSNDYLGLANNEEVKKAAMEAVARYGAGAGASRLVSGTLALHEELEERLRRFKGAEAVLLFNSGYAANLGVITTLAGRGAEIFSDRLNHASIIDASLLSRARLRRYPHRDVGALEKLLKSSSAGRKIIVTEGVFSMDGDLAPLEDIISLLEPHGALLYLDDAHAFGAIGPTGRGTMEALGLAPNPRVIEMATLGKALGSFGAFVACSPELKALLTTRARAFVYTTALPPGVAAASIKAVDVLDENPGLVARLQANAVYMRDALGARGISTMNSASQIIPLPVGGAQRAMELSNDIFNKGVFIQGIRPPTVPEGTARLRLTLSAAHTREDMDRAAGVISDCFNAPSGRGASEAGLSCGEGGSG